MHFVKYVEYIEDYKLVVTFENNIKKIIDLRNHLNRGIFKPLKNVSYFKTVSVDEDLDTIVWDNGADISPDFLFEIGKDIKKSSSLKTKKTSRSRSIRKNQIKISSHGLKRERKKN